ncbi:MAG: AAA family ATPase [Bacteroidota bacterium]|nr:AAA family ATPase [Bacteroidota bacterium]
MAYYKRDIETELYLWKNESDRHPLLIRGARQVGKSSVIRNLGSQFKNFIEVNFEQEQDVKTVFAGNLNPQRICEQLSVIYDTPIVPGETLLFLDEIQSCLPAISSLRFFYEKYPELHVIAAGSLLEFALSELPSFGVGRISSLFLYPFSFGEFIEASGAGLLRKAIAEASPQNPLSEPVHRKALDLYKRFLILGGMPKIVSTYLEAHDLLKCQRVLDDLIYSYEDDFAKYKKRASTSVIREVFKSVVEQNGQKFVYSNTSPDLNRMQVKGALELLTMAGLIIPITHSSANGIPLGAEVNPKKRKFIVFDSGIFQRLLGLNLSEILLKDDFQSINKGNIAELNVGLELIKSASCYQRQSLYYWQREAKNSNAEVDYLIQIGLSILPIEVKSGTKGSMQSLYLFMDSKNSEKGMRVSQENFSFYDKIEVFPLYAVGNLYHHSR